MIVPIGQALLVVDGDVRRDLASRAAAADDFGHMVHHMPEAVVRPGSDGDLASVLRCAARNGRRVAPQGRRHSVFGCGQAAGGVAVDMRGRCAVHSVRRDWVVVDAGATWRQVLAATLPQGLAPATLPDYLDLTVGGTVSVGGVGATTSRWGVQSDTVGELEVVTGRGLTLTCSPTAHQGLFDAVRAGLGQAAIITRVTLRLVPAPRHARRFLLTYPTLSAMLNDQRRLVTEDRFDAVQGAVLAAPSGGWTFRLDAVKQFSGRAPDDGALLAGLSDDRAQAQPTTMPYLVYRDRLAALERALRASGQWSLPHPWLCTFVGDAAVEQVVARELEQLRPADLGEAGQVALSPIRRAPVRSPLIRMPSDELCYAVNLLRFPDTTGATQAGRLVAANRAAYDRIRAAGGTLYPVSAFPMTPHDWRQHFGPALGLLADAKRDHDPDHILTPGYEIFDA